MNQKRQKISLEMLSAYLDNQLSEKDRSRVESALQVDAGLKQELSMLDATRRLLRHAPILKVPRNFTLTASMVKKQNPFKFWMPAMSFSSALAAVLFVLSFIFNFNPVATSLIVQSRNMDQFAAVNSVTAESMEMDNSAEKSVTEETPMIIQWFGEQANGMGGGQGAQPADGAIIAEEVAPMVAEAPAYGTEAELEIPAMDEASGTAADATMSEMPAEESAPAMEESFPSAKDGPVIETNSDFDEANEAPPNLILGVSPEEERGQIIEESQQVMTQVHSEETQRSDQNTTFLAIFRIGLSLLSITFAIIAYLMHRQRA